MLSVKIKEMQYLQSGSRISDLSHRTVTLYNLYLNPRYNVLIHGRQQAVLLEFRPAWCALCLTRTSHHHPKYSKHAIMNLDCSDKDLWHLVSAPYVWKGIIFYCCVEVICIIVNSDEQMNSTCLFLCFVQYFKVYYIKCMSAEKAVWEEDQQNYKQMHDSCWSSQNYFWAAL